MSKQTTTDFEAILEDILQRWFKNPPFPLPVWVDKDFMRGITEVQQIEIKSAVSELVRECIGEDEMTGKKYETTEDYVRNKLRAEQRKRAGL